MKKILFTLFTITLLLTLIASCKDEVPISKDKEIPDKSINIVTQFVYDGMSSLYFWNDDIIDEKPTFEDEDPKKYFERLLSGADKEYEWSWITDDAQALVADFAGKPMTFGYTLGFISIDSIIYGYVKYVYNNTPAYNAGLKRLDLIGEINGERITVDERGYISNKDVDLLYGSKPVTFTIYEYKNNGIEKTKDNVNIKPIVSHTDPVVFDTIFTIGDKTIGYLFYTSFISNFNFRLHEVFLNFKQKGVTDLILDLRYNRGGDITAATYLASLIAPKAFVEQKDILTILSYNKDIGQNIYKLGEYVEKDIITNGEVTSKAEPNPLDANLNLNNISIIATSDSYSASELITFCLRQQMDKVTHIGSKTGGKYTASITVHAYDEKIGFDLYPILFPRKTINNVTRSALKNWALQPIVAIYTDNKGNDFIETNGLIPDKEIYEGFGYIDYWKPLGDTDDTLLGESIYLITGNENYKPVLPNLRSSTAMKTYDIANPKKGLREESVLINNFNPMK
ncbi:S41 family peptidase [Lascolabacillus sp.]|uniref:S41 family peptidase n=1 Tax=Lascolabacillus sp. TaxID=1924068 RepID=UPI002585B278|nr:S41 family peptidase [Lascolabacillus sp.]MDD2607892.1 S41 family peptidase [Lascolabacillus sp.]